MPGRVLRKFQAFRSVANMDLWQKMVKFDKKLRLIAINALLKCPIYERFMSVMPIPAACMFTKNGSQLGWS
ncbi:MAG TPA: hypothetical protein VGR30_16310 [Candidatus Binatia bacterium]|jgi:hypothetical protein|nr:hypothetical protein [Candidatus Binatia bacterium]